MLQVTTFSDNAARKYKNDIRCLRFMILNEVLSIENEQFFVMCTKTTKWNTYFEELFTIYVWELSHMSSRWEGEP